MNMTNAEIAIVLTDIIGSTKFVQQHGPEVATVWFSTHDKLVMNLITRFNGQWIDSSDGHLMYFGNVQDAVAFASIYKKKLRLNFPFTSRVGIHWDSMVIVRTEQRLVDGGVKKVNIEGIGKNLAARTMSICGPNQILLSNRAYLKFKARLTSNPHIPKNILVVCAGLYRFKGISSPEQIWVLAFSQNDIQSPPSNEKAIRLGGKKKIKTHFKHKLLKEKLFVLLNSAFKLSLFYLIVIFWPFLASHSAKSLWGVDYLLLKPIEYLDYYFKVIVYYIKDVLK
jgi:class 3 adenylate cyclase